MTTPDTTMRTMNAAIGTKLRTVPSEVALAWLSINDLARDHSIGYEFYEALIAGGYQELWTLADMPIPWQNVMRDQVEDMTYSRWCATEPVRRATALGHVVEHDPPWGLTSADRWTCTACGAAVLQYSENIYGSAALAVCEPLPSNS